MLDLLNVIQDAPAVPKGVSQVLVCDGEEISFVDCQPSSILTDNELDL